MTSVGVIGLGYVGREVVKLSGRQGFDVVGHDVDEEAMRTLDRDLGGQELDANVTFERSAADVVANSEVVVIAVPTPLDSSYSVDLSALRSAVTSAADGIDPDGCSPLMIVESTVPPGTVENVVKPLLEDEGVQVGKNVYLAHAPERIDPGNEEWALEDLPRVVGAVSEHGLDRAVGFYTDLLNAEVHPVDSPEIAEAAKIIENAFRDINIAFVNEIALSLGELGVDTGAALDAAATKPFGFTKFEPGAGVGGHCIPVDPYLLIDQAEQSGFNHRFLKTARDINDQMPGHVVEETVRALNDRRILPNGASVLLLGKSFKPDVRDARNSPYFEIKAGLEEYGCETALYDPLYPEDSDVDVPYAEVDAVVLVTNHKEFTDIDLSMYDDLGVDVFVDGRNLLDRDESVNLKYVGIGR